MRSEFMVALNRIERSFAYERAASEIQGACMLPTFDGALLEDWRDLRTAASPVADEVAYLDARRLLERHYADAMWVRVLDEDAPLPVKVVLQ